MSRRFQSLFFLSVILGLSACREPPADTGQVVSTLPQVTEEDLGSDFDMADTSSPGGQAYMRVCASCHEQGLNKAPHRAMLLLMSAQSIHRAMTEGVMQAQAASLSPDEKVAVAEFLAGNRMQDVFAEPLACEGTAADFDYDEPPVFEGWGLNPEGTHAISTELAGLDKANIGTLKLKWAFAYPGAVRTRSQPGLAGGALYVGSHGGTVYAFDRQTGCVRWSFDASSEVRNAIVISPWTPGDESAEPMAYFGDLIGNLYALDAVTGDLKWRERPSEHPNTTLTATPSLHDGTLYVPISSLEVVPAREPDYECCNFRGSVIAYDAVTGKRKWQTFTIPELPVAQAKNAAGTQNYGPSGAPIWNSPAIDLKRHQLTVGTGENYSSPASGESDAIIAFDLTSGKVNWVFQATVGDAWNTACGSEPGINCPAENGPDYDFGAGTLLAKDRTGREYVIGGQKSGWVHALDPDTGELVWQTKVGRGGVHAGVYFGMAAEGGRLYVPMSDTPDGREYDEPARPGMYALDLATGEFLWKMPAKNVCREDQKFCNPGYPQAITATPELVLAGSNDGHFRVFDAGNGEILWDIDTAVEYETVGGGNARGGSFGGGAAPLAYQGELILNSGYGFAGKMPGNALLVFEVDP